MKPRRKRMTKKDKAFAEELRPPRIPESLRAIQGVVEDLQEQLDSAKETFRLEIIRLVRAAPPSDHDLPPDDEDIEVPVVWSCNKSPVDTCVYSVDIDPYCDWCLYCGSPRERK